MCVFSLCSVSNLSMVIGLVIFSDCFTFAMYSSVTQGFDTNNLSRFWNSSKYLMINELNLQEERLYFERCI